MPIVRFVPVLLLFATSLWPRVSISGPLNESISVIVNLTGDLTGQYEFSGPINQNIKADPSVAGGCESNFLFRKVKSKGKPMIEAWPTFICNINGQKKTYKLHRSFLDPALEVQQFVIKSLDENIRNVSMEFRDLSLQKSK